MKQREIPLGISEEYDDLPSEGEAEVRWCQYCAKQYVDHLRIMPDGCKILAGFCIDCRWLGRVRLRARRSV